MSFNPHFTRTCSEIKPVIEQLIKEKLAQLRKLKAEKEKVCESLELQLQELQEGIQQKGLPFDQQAEVIETELKILIMEVAHTIKTDDGAVYFRKGGVRVTYDSNALDMLCASRKDIKDAIIPFRKETQVKPSVSIELY